jgi:rhamnosyltransferase
MKKMYRVALVVPTLNAGDMWPACLAAVAEQNYLLHRKLVIDSSSTDDTVKLAQANGFEVLTIVRAEFNHGATRQMAVEYLSDCDLVVFLTQDAILAKQDAIERLVSVFNNPDVSLSYGRQLPHSNAKLIGTHARLFNYSTNSRIKERADIPNLGIKTTFCSDSFACYRRTDLLSIGGFKSDLIFGEDAQIAARLVLGNKKIAYVAEALVYHSHDYTLTQDFKRYFDIGVFHAREAEIFSQFGNVSGEGLRFVRSELAYVYNNRQLLLIFSVIIRTFAKYIAYKIGRYERILPLSLKRLFSMHRGYWK